MTKLKVIVNPDKSIAEEVKLAVKNNDGYCPCKLEKNADTKCMCKEFRQQNTEGQCHCGLYVKVQ